MMEYESVEYMHIPFLIISVQLDFNKAEKSF